MSRLIALLTVSVLLLLVQTSSGKPLSTRKAERQKRGLPPKWHVLGQEVELFDEDGHSVDDPDHLNPENAEMHTITDIVTEGENQHEEEYEEYEGVDPWWEFFAQYNWEWPDLNVIESNLIPEEENSATPLQELEYSGEESGFFEEPMLFSKEKLSPKFKEEHLFIEGHNEEVD